MIFISKLHVAYIFPASTGYERMAVKYILETISRSWPLASCIKSFTAPWGDSFDHTKNRHDITVMYNHKLFAN